MNPGLVVTGFVLLSLPLSTGALEVATGLALAWSLFSGNLRARLDDPWMPGALALAAVYTLSPLAGGPAREGIGHAWILAPLLALPTLTDARALRLGLGAAAVAGLWALAQRAAGAGGHAAFSHHLTLAYALLPPLAVAVHGRAWWAAVPMALGVLASGSDAAPIALIATVIALRGDDKWRAGALLGGAAATVAALALFADREELRQRAVLWTGALQVPPGTAGAGGYGTATETLYAALDHDFYFPNHAHDSLLQLHAAAGLGALAALAALVAAVFRRGHPAAAAGLVGVLVGGLTQDTLGDLEVARAAFTWIAVLGTSGQDRGQVST